MTLKDTPLLGILSKGSRGLVLFVLCLLLVGVVVLWKAETTPLSGDITTVTHWQETSLDLAASLEAQDWKGLSRQWQDLSGSEAFFAEAEDFGFVTDVRTEWFDDGILFSFFATSSEGSVLHPYVGYLQEESLVWGETGDLKIIEPYEQGEKQGWIIENEGPYPLEIKKHWKEQRTKTAVFLMSREGKQVLAPGEQGILLFPAGVEPELPVHLEQQEMPIHFVGEE